ncbi:MAG: hypothetical protein ACOY4R_07315 [Pseudomonadota bacterium]
MFRGHIFSMATTSLLVAAFAAVLCSSDSAFAGRGDDWSGWRVEEGVDVPSYAAVIPDQTNLNIDAVVLGCERIDDGPVLQLQVYLKDDGPLRPDGADVSLLKSAARTEIAVDDQIFPVSLLFAGDYAVLADASDGPFPKLSGRLIQAMQIGGTMALRFDLLSEAAGQPPAFDGEALVDLRSGHQAIGAMRRCAMPETAPGTALLH